MVDCFIASDILKLREEEWRLEIRQVSIRHPSNNGCVVTLAANSIGLLPCVRASTGACEELDESHDCMNIET